MTPTSYSFPRCAISTVHEVWFANGTVRRSCPVVRLQYTPSAFSVSKICRTYELIQEAGKTTVFIRMGLNTKLPNPDNEIATD